MKKTQSAKSKKWQRKKAKQTRSLSEIKYTHWWREHPVWNNGTAMPLDEQKAAVFYEAYRRVLEIRNAWLEGIRGPEAIWRFGWQMFVAGVVQYLPRTWLELGSAKNVFLQYLPEMLSPVGYSVYPAKPEFKDKDGNKKKKKDLTPDELKALKDYDERRRKLAVKFPVIPSVNPSLNEQSASPFLKELTKLSDAGFVLVAIDNKTSEAFKYGIQLLQRYFKGKRSFRTADINYKFPEEAPAVPSLNDDYVLGYTWDKISKMSKAQRDALGVAMAQKADADAIHAEARVIGKRRKQHEVRAEKVFEFQEFCKELERFDETQRPEDRGLVKRLRWCTRPGFGSEAN